MLLGLVKFLFWFFFISYLIKFTLRLLTPFILKYFTNKMKDHLHHPFNKQNQNAKSNDEGKVIFENNRRPTKKRSDDVGDYIDFEEVDD